MYVDFYSMGETISFDGGLSDGEENVLGSFALRIYIPLFDMESERWTLYDFKVYRNGYSMIWYLLRNLFPCVW